MGLDETFLTGVVASLGNGSSALLIYVSQDGLVDTQRLLNVLGLFKGMVHHTTFPAAVEEAILDQGGEE